MQTKELLFACLLFFAGGITNQVTAQGISVVEPDTTSADLIYIVTPDNQLKAMPFETGDIKRHKNKFGKIASIVGNVAGAASALGGITSIVGVHTNSIGTAFNGIKIMGTAGNVANLAGVTENLAGAEGQDFTYDDPSSKTKVKLDGKDLTILANIKCKDKESALTLFKVVRFKATKKDRRLQWFQTKASLINTEKSDEASKAGYLPFGYQSYGDHSSLLTIPSRELSKGEYGVYFLGNMFGGNMSILCYTFSVE